MTKRPSTGYRQRLKERFLEGDENSCTEENLLELLLTYSIPRKDVKPLAKELLQEFGSLSLLLKAYPERLCQFKGVKFNTIVLFKLVDRIITYNEKKPIKKGKEVPRTKQLSLPKMFEHGIQHPVSERKLSTLQPISAERSTPKKTKKRTGLFGKAVLKEAIDLLPGLPDTESLKDVRKHIRDNLHYSAEQTRIRYANYIVGRMFPENEADTAMRRFAKKFGKTQALRDVCFYRFLKAEPLELEIIEKFLLKNVGQGQLQRGIIKNYLSERFPAAKSINSCAQAVVDALKAARIAKVNRTTISYRYRDIPLPAFAFVVHSEFSEPGMYDISLLESNRYIKAMLWSPNYILSSLFELRNKGIISKISQIDGIRQFTTKWDLDQTVEFLTTRNL